MNGEPPSSFQKKKSWLQHITAILRAEPNNQEELLILLQNAEQKHVLNAAALSMIEGILQMSQLQVRDVMLPRTQISSIPHNADLKTLLPEVIQSGHSRLPVLGEQGNEVLGILHAKDLLPYFFDKAKDDFQIEEVVRPATFVPEGKHLNELLSEFRINHNHMAIVVDEYGNIAGLITIEDVLEQIVGEIEDEFDIDDTANAIKKISANQFTVKALTSIEDFNQHFNVALDDSEFTTIGGVIAQRFGHLPKRGETTTIDDLTFKVLHADHRRIRLIKVIRQAK